MQRKYGGMMDRKMWLSISENKAQREALLVSQQIKKNDYNIQNNYLFIIY